MSVQDKKIAISTALAEAKELHMLRLEMFSSMAADYKAKFDAYVQAGFTEAQALRLCCAELGEGG